MTRVCCERLVSRLGRAKIVIHELAICLAELAFNFVPRTVECESVHRTLIATRGAAGCLEKRDFSAEGKWPATARRNQCGHRLAHDVEQHFRLASGGGCGNGSMRKGPVYGKPTLPKKPKEAHKMRL